MKRTCKQCGKDFFLSKSEIEFYKKKNLTFPKRCRECREANKIAKGDNKVNNSPVMNVDKTKKQNSIPTNHMDEPQQAQALAPTTQNTSKSKAYIFIVAILVIAAILYGLFGDFNSSEPVDTTGGIEITDTVSNTYSFRNQELLNEHYDKHGIEMGFANAASYEKAASDVINNPDALYKVQAEDGDGVYFVEATNDFVVLSSDGYIRTYFRPGSGKKYFDKQ